jgi:hypothetical protein
MMAAGTTSLYLGCAALLIAAVMLRFPPKVRAGLFTVMILATIAGGQNQRIERVASVVVAAAD